MARPPLGIIAPSMSVEMFENTKLDSGKDVALLTKEI
jgi:hypothetical protein